MAELEALAMHYGIKQCHLYLSGLQHFDVVTDHHPLKSVFNSKDLFDIDNDKLMKINRNFKASMFLLCTTGKELNMVYLMRLGEIP